MDKGREWRGDLQDHLNGEALGGIARLDFLAQRGIGWPGLVEHATQSLSSWFERLGQSCGGGGVCGALGCGH